MSIHLNTESYGRDIPQGWVAQDTEPLMTLECPAEARAAAVKIRNAGLRKLREYIKTLIPGMTLRRIEVKTEGRTVGSLATWRAVVWVPTENPTPTAARGMQAEFEALQEEARDVRTEAGDAVNSAIIAAGFGRRSARTLAGATEDSLPRFAVTPESQALPPPLEAAANSLLQASGLGDYETAQLNIIQGGQAISSPKAFPNL